MDDTASNAMSPLIFSTIQGAYVNKLTLAFTSMNHYAVQLFYILAALEIAFFGIIWALRQQEMLGTLLIKIIKLGFIFFLISNYRYLLSIIVGGFASLGLNASTPKIAALIFNPDKIWSFGFDSSISLLQLAVQYGTTNMGITIIYLTLGFGLLFLFALIATQVLILVISFYILSLLALLLLPFGSLTFTQNLSYRALHGVLQAGARIFAFVLVLGVGIGILTSLHATAFSQTTTIDQPLGLFFATFIITVLCFIMPMYAGRAIGEFGNNFFSVEAPQTNVNVTASAPSITVSPLAQVASASNVISQTNVATQAANSVSAMSPAVNIASSAGGASNTSHLGQSVSELTKAVRLQRQEGISRETLNKLKHTFKNVINQNK
jgi:P-type conjugative transfer protein TrbL